MMLYSNVILLCLGIFLLAVSTSGMVYNPDKFPFNWWTISGHVLFILTVLCFHLAKK